MTGAGDRPPDTTPVRPGYALDAARLAAWLNSHVEGFRGPLTVEQFTGGQSNPTYKLTTPGRCYVLRRKPPGKLLKGAHAVEREARVLTALRAADYPVAKVFALCTDNAVVGTWFYVMELVEGRIFWDNTLPGVPREHRPTYFRALNNGLARMALTLAAAG